MKPARAIFLDRDGVLTNDVGLLQKEEDIEILPGVPEALRLLKKAGYQLIVVSNQTVIARGLLTEREVERLQRIIEDRLIHAGAPALNGFYYCPHHPNADVPAYRVACDCRKPKPGLLIRASSELGVTLADSVMIGDRITDIMAGAAAACRTILVETGQHDAPPIQTSDPLDLTIRPDATCTGLLEAAHWILEGK